MLVPSIYALGMAASFFAATVLVAGDRAHRPIVTSKQQVSGYTGIKDSWQALRLFQRRLDRLDKPFVFAISRKCARCARQVRTSRHGCAQKNGLVLCTHVDSPGLPVVLDGRQSRVITK